MARVSNKTVAVTLRFYTNDLEVVRGSADKAGLACWDTGVAILEANKEKKIAAIHCPIQCFEDIIPAVKELFRKSGVLVVSSNRRPRVLSHTRRKK